MCDSDVDISSEETLGSCNETESQVRGEFTNTEDTDEDGAGQNEDEYFDYELELQRQNDMLTEKYGVRASYGTIVEGLVLTRLMIDFGLSNIGRPVQSTQVCYLTFQACSRNLVDISELRPYIHLTTVILVDNKLQNLHALEGMRNLKVLNAENNSISSTSDIPLPKFTWLQALNLGSNKLTLLEDIQPNSLMYLNLSKNMLESVEIFTAEYFPNLLSLELRGNQLTSIEGLELPKLRHLYIAENKVEDLSGINGCPSLQLLHARQNRIKKLSITPTLDKLEYINLRDNRIDQFTETMNLGNCSNVKTLILTGNPIVQSKRYAEELVAACMSLKRLDKMILSEIDIVDGRLRRNGRIDGTIGPLEDDLAVVKAELDTQLEVNDDFPEEDGETINA